MKRLQGFVLTVQRMVTCTYHLNPPATISIYGWRFQARHYCAYNNGLPCLFRLRAPPFTLQLKLLHSFVSFWETNYKKQPPECSVRKGVLRNLAKFNGKHLCQSLFFNKAAGLRPATLLKKRLWYRCFPVNFAKFLRTPFLQNTSGRLLLK